MNIDIEVTDEEGRRLMVVAGVHRITVSELVTNNLRTSLRDYERQSLHPMQQRESPLIVSRSTHRVGKVHAHSTATR